MNKSCFLFYCFILDLRLLPIPDSISSGVLKHATFTCIWKTRQTKFTKVMCDHAPHQHKRSITAQHSCLLLVNTCHTSQYKTIAYHTVQITWQTKTLTRISAALYQSLNSNAVLQYMTNTVT